MSEVKGFKSLEVWQRARLLVVRLYDFTSNLPDEEKFGLAAQIRRAAVSIPSNIAEGYGRKNPMDYARFLRIAKGSVNEIETLLILCEDLNLVHIEPNLMSEVAEIGSQLTNLIAKVAPPIARELVTAYGDVED